MCELIATKFTPTYLFYKKCMRFIFFFGTYGMETASPPICDKEGFKRYMSSVAAAGAVSRKSIKSYSPAGVRTSMNPPLKKWLNVRIIS